MNQSLIERRTNIRWYQAGLHKYLLSTKGGRAIDVAHRRWGKDEIALDAEFKCANFPNEIHNGRIGTYWHCLPEYSQARKAMWTAVNTHTGKRRIDEMFPMVSDEKSASFRHSSRKLSLKLSQTHFVLAFLAQFKSSRCWFLILLQSGHRYHLGAIFGFEVLV